MEPPLGWRPFPWSQVPRDTVLKLALCLFLLECSRWTRAQPSCREEEYPVGTECCPKCSPGYHVKQACSELTGTVCIPCPPGTYTAHPNGLSQCLPCRDCDPAMGLGTRQKCSSTGDAVCGCRQGYFCQAEDGDHCSMCWPHTICQPGQRVQKRGTYSQDTVCTDCPPGTFSLNGTLEQCLPWTKCMGWWIEVEAEPGTSSRDVSCSYSWQFYFILVILFVILIPVLTITWIWMRRKKSTGALGQAKSALQWKRRDEAGDIAVIEALQVPPDVTTVAVEETAPVFKEDPNG